MGNKHKRKSRFDIHRKLKDGGAENKKEKQSFEQNIIAAVKFSQGNWYDALQSLRELEDEDVSHALPLPLEPAPCPPRARVRGSVMASVAAGLMSPPRPQRAAE